MKRLSIVGCTIAAALFAVSPASAVTNLVANGGFDTITTPTSNGQHQSYQMSTDGSVSQAALGYNDGQTQATQYVTGWVNTVSGCIDVSSCENAIYGKSTTSAYNMVLTSPTATIHTNDNSTMTLDSATKADTRPGGGGNFLAADSSYETGMIMQVINNLVVGQKYQLSFDYAVTQQSGYTGSNSVYWTANFINTNDGSAATYSTPSLTIQQQGFSGWSTASTIFTATSTSEILGFVAGTSAGGQPPFALLDNISLSSYSSSAVPEPASWAMMMAGFGLMGVIMRRSRLSMKDFLHL